MSKKYLITGGAGFIGSHLAEALSVDNKVIILDNLRSGYKKNLDGIEHDFVEGSVENRRLLEDVSQGVDCIFHLAALISVPESLEKPFETVSINVDGTLNVLEAAKKNKVRKVIFASSAAVYGDDPAMPKVETMLPAPLSPYAVTKLDGEYYCSIYSGNNWVETSVLRFFNVFGARQDPASKYAAAIPIFINQALQGKAINVFGDGEQTRDFVYVKDVINALTWLLDKGNSEVYNISGEGIISINELALMINKMCKNESPVVYLPERPGDIKHSAASIDKLKETGFKIKYLREDSITETYKYYKENIRG